MHDRYQSRAEVAQALRRSQTVELALRPVPVRTAASTRGPLLVVMPAYLLMNELGRRWSPLDRTVAEGRDRLNTAPSRSPASFRCCCNHAPTCRNF